MRVLFILTGLILLTCGCDANQSMADRDNTSVNERDAQGDTKTPFDQSNEQADIDQVSEIRARVLEIDDLSTNGRNVKIITNQGKVVLRGPVNSAAERDSIVAVAANIVGASNVTDQLEVESH